MPLANGSNVLANAKVGSQQVASIRHGINLVWNNIITLQLTSSTEINLRTFIDTQADYTDKRVIVNIAASEIIGSTSIVNHAVTTGDLTKFEWVELHNYGEIQGVGGAANGGQGGLAFGCDAITNLNFTFRNYGAVRAGGGGGGNGGLGGKGMTTVNQLGPYHGPTGISCLADHDYNWIYGASNPVDCGCWWAGVKVFTASYTFYTHRVGDKWYWPGYAAEPGNYMIYRGDHREGVKGAGGAGGAGQGYNQVVVVGDDGASGTNRAGAGGKGGNGASWGAPGGNGIVGGGGLFYSDATRNNPSLGDNGIPGGPTNYAISGNQYMTFINNGTVDGWTI